MKKQSRPFSAEELRRIDGLLANGKRVNDVARDLQVAYNTFRVRLVQSRMQVATYRKLVPAEHQQTDF